MSEQLPGFSVTEIRKEFEESFKELEGETQIELQDLIPTFFRRIRHAIKYIFTGKLY